MVESTITRNRDGTTSYSMVLKMNSAISQDEIFSYLEQNSNVLTFRQTIIT